MYMYTYAYVCTYIYIYIYTYIYTHGCDVSAPAHTFVWGPLRPFAHVKQTIRFSGRTNCLVDYYYSYDYDYYYYDYAHYHYYCHEPLGVPCWHPM